MSEGIYGSGVGGGAHEPTRGRGCSELSCPLIQGPGQQPNAPLRSHQGLYRRSGVGGLLVQKRARKSFPGSAPCRPPPVAGGPGGVRLRPLGSAAFPGGHQRTKPLE